MNGTARLSAYRFRIPFRRSVMLGGQSFSYRDGILLEREGRWAEASPLPGFSRESIDDVIAVLQGTPNDLQEEFAGRTKKSMARCISPLIPAALEFGLSSLDQPQPCRLQVPLNKLLMGDPEQILADAQQCNREGFSAVKLKVGRGCLDSEISLVRQVRELLQDQIQLRLDANQAWTLKQARRFAQETESLHIQYIEEPLQNSLQLEQLYRETHLPYALDESLIGGSTLEDWPSAAALVCKPTILGGRTEIERLASTGKPVVFSSAFESGVGIARIMQLAMEFSPSVPAGLDTLGWMAGDLLMESPRQQGEAMILDRLEVNQEVLESLI